MAPVTGRVPFYFNDREIQSLAADLGCTIRVESCTNPFGGAPDVLLAATFPGRAGQTVVGDRARAEPIQVGFGLRIEAANLLALRVATEAVIAFVDGTIKLRTGYAENREAWGRLTGLSIADALPGNASVKIALTYTIDSPYWSEKQPTPLNMANQVRVPVLIGSAASSPLIRAWGPATGPIVFTLRDHRGFARAVLSVNTNLTGNDWMLIDNGDRAIQKSTAGTLSTIATGIAFLVAGTDYLVFDPRDSDRYNQFSQTLDVDDAAHTVTASLAYDRHYK